MAKPSIQIGTEVREMTAQEYEQWKKDVIDAEKRAVAAEAKTAAIESGRAKLAALGLTGAEVAALLGG